MCNTLCQKCKQTTVEFEDLSRVGRLRGPECETVAQFRRSISQNRPQPGTTNKILFDMGASKLQGGGGVPPLIHTPPPQTPLLAVLGHCYNVRDEPKDPASVTCMHACIHACMRVCKHACIHTCVHACMHTYIQPRSGCTWDPGIPVRGQSWVLGATGVPGIPGSRAYLGVGHIWHPGVPGSWVHLGPGYSRSRGVPSM